MKVVSWGNVYYSESLRRKGGFAHILSHEVMCRVLLSDMAHKNGNEHSNIL